MGTVEVSGKILTKYWVIARRVILWYSIGGIKFNGFTSVNFRSSNITRLNLDVSILDKTERFEKDAYLQRLKIFVSCF